jgi:hypothetical protein
VGFFIERPLLFAQHEQAPLHEAEVESDLLVATAAQKAQITQNWRGGIDTAFRGFFPEF